MIHVEIEDGTGVKHWFDFSKVTHVKEDVHPDPQVDPKIATDLLIYFIGGSFPVRMLNFTMDRWLKFVKSLAYQIQLQQK